MGEHSLSLVGSVGITEEMALEYRAVEMVAVNSYRRHHTDLLLERAFSTDCKSICKHFVNFCKDHLQREMEK